MSYKSINLTFVEMVGIILLCLVLWKKAMLNAQYVECGLSFECLCFETRKAGNQAEKGTEGIPGVLTL